ncbi:MAG: hypothetical protein V4736_06985 [Bdellovibrionota bacterium]
MPETYKNKNLSPLTETVFALDNYFSELIRLGEKIDTMEMKSEFDYEQAERLINRFTECGQGVTDEVVRLSTGLQDLRQKAEAAAQLVQARAEKLNLRKRDTQSKMDELRALGEKVRVLTLSLNDLIKVEGETATDQERAEISMRLSKFELELRPLIDEANKLQEEGRESKMKLLEQSADSLRQSLLAISQKLSVFQQSNPSTLN